MTLDAIPLPDEAEAKLEELEEANGTARWSIKHQLAIKAVNLIDQNHANMQEAKRQARQQAAANAAADGGEDGDAGDD